MTRNLYSCQTDWARIHQIITPIADSNTNRNTVVGVETDQEFLYRMKTTAARSIADCRIFRGSRRGGGRESRQRRPADRWDTGRNAQCRCEKSVDDDRAPVAELRGS